MAQAIDFTAYWHYGDSFDDIVIDVQNPDGSPMSLSGYVAIMDIRLEPDSATTSLSLTTNANDGITIDAATGQVRIDATFSKMLSGALAVDIKYHYQVQIKNSEKRRTLLKGRFVSLADIAEN